MNILIYIQLIMLYTQQIIGTRRAVTPPRGLLDNPNFIRDRSNYIIEKPDMPPVWTDRYTPSFNPQWMDYCDPYHCKYNDRNVCGLNRRRMRFKVFQSKCHLILNNKCSVFRGFLKYDLINIKFCRYYKISMRSGCPEVEQCADLEGDPICAINSRDGRIVLFQNQCFMEIANCKNSDVAEYDEIYMSFCEKGLHMKIDTEEKYKNKTKQLDDD